MSDSNRTLTINISVNTGKAVQSLNALKTALGQMVQAGSMKGLENTAQQVEATLARTAAASKNAAAATGNMASAQKTASTQFYQYNNAASQAAIGLRKYGDSIAMQARGTRYYTDSTDAATRTTAALSNSVSQAVTPVTMIAGRFAQYDIATKMWSNTTRAANPVVTQLSGSVQNSIGVFGRLRASLEQNVDKMDQARRSAYAMTIAGFQLKMAGDAIVGSLKAASATFADFDFSMRRAAGALSIMDDKSKMFEELGSSIQDAAKEVKLFNPQEIAQGVYYWASTTGQAVKTQDELNAVMGQTIPIMKMAAMNEMNLEAALKGVFSITSQFGLGVESANAVTEKLQYVAMATATEVTDLLESLKMLGPIAAGFGVSLDDVLKTLSELGNVGIKGSMAGRALAMMFAKIAEPTAAATKALDEYMKKAGKLGTFQEAIFPKGQFIGIQGFLNILSDLTKNLTMQEKQALMTLITTQNEWRALAPLVDQNTKSIQEFGKGVLDMSTGLDDASQRFQDQWALMGDSVNAMLGELQNKFAPLIMTIGSAAVEAFRGWAGVLGDIAVWLDDIFKANPGLASVVVSVTALIGVLMAASGAALLLAGGFKLIAHVAIPSILLDGLNALKLGLVGATVETETLGAALATTGKKGGLLASIGQAVAPEIQKVKSLFISAANGIVSAMQPVFNKLSSLGAAAGRMAGTVWGSGFGVAAAAALAVAAVVIWKQIDDQLDAQSRELTAKTTEFVKTATKEQLEAAKEATKKGMEQIGQIMFALPAGLGTFLYGDQFEQLKQQYHQLDEALVAETNRAAIEFHAAQERMWTAADVPQKAAEQATSYVTIATETLQSNEAIVSGAIDMLFSKGNIAAQRGGQKALMAWVNGAKNSIPEIGPVVTAFYDGAVGMMESNIPKVRQAGNATMIALAEALKTGNIDKVIPAFRNVLATANNLITSNNPKMKQAGFRMLIELAQGFRNNKNLDAATKTQLYLAIKQLASGNANFQIAGANMVLSVANGMISKQDVLTGAAKAMRDKVAGMFGANIAQSIFGSSTAGKPLDLLELMGFTSAPEDVSGAGGGGGGGAAEKKQSPLEKALETAKGAADLAESLQKVAGLDVKAMVQKSMKPLAEAMLLADKITYQITKSFGTKKLQEVAEFSDASQKVASMIGTAVDAFSKMADFKRPPETTLRAVANSVATLVDLVAKSSKKLKTDGVAAAVVFSDSAGKVMTMIGGALDAFSKISDEFPKMPGDDFWDALVTLVASLTVKVGEAAKDIKGELTKAAKDFSDNAGSVMNLIGGALEAFSKTQEYIAPTEGLISSLVESVKLAVTAILNLSKEMNIDPKVMADLGTFSKSVSDIVGAIKSTAEAFAPLKQEIIDPEKEQWIPVSVFDQISNMRTTLDAIRGLADGIDMGTLKSMERLAGVAEKISGAIKSFFEMSQPQKQSTEDGAAPVEFQNLGEVVSGVLGGIMSAMTTFVGKMDGVGSSLVGSIIQGMQSQEAALSMEVARINSILGGVGGTASFSWSVAARPNPVQVNVDVQSSDGSVGNMSLAQIEQAINAGLGNIQNAFNTA